MRLEGLWFVEVCNLVWLHSRKSFLFDIIVVLSLFHLCVVAVAAVVQFVVRY